MVFLRIYLCHVSIVTLLFMVCNIFLLHHWLISKVEALFEFASDTLERSCHDKSVCVRCWYVVELLVLEQVQVPEQLNSVRFNVQPLPAPLHNQINRDIYMQRCWLMC